MGHNYEGFLVGDELVESCGVNIAKFARCIIFVAKAEALSLLGGRLEDGRNWLVILAVPDGIKEAKGANKESDEV